MFKKLITHVAAAAVVHAQINTQYKGCYEDEGNWDFKEMLGNVQKT